MEWVKNTGRSKLLRHILTILNKQRNLLSEVVENTYNTEPIGLYQFLSFQVKAVVCRKMPSGSLMVTRLYQ